jgi:hypothetical protein
MHSLEVVQRNALVEQSKPVPVAKELECLARGLSLESLEAHWAGRPSLMPHKLAHDHCQVAELMSLAERWHV